MTENKYPLPMEVDYLLMASAAKTILMQHGKLIPWGTTKVFEDRLIKISFSPGTGTRSSEFEIVRKAMPGHEKEQLRKGSNPLYMEHMGECIRVHGEAKYIYRYIMELLGRNNPNPDDWGIKEDSLWMS